MAQPRLFSLEEANSLVPQLTEIVGRQLERQVEIDTRLRNLVRMIGHVPRSLDLASSDSAEVRSLKRELIDRIRAFEAGWEPVSSLGAVVKDPRLGLIDFYALVGGRFVWLCWQYGENRIGSFHELDDSFPARKRILPNAQRQLLN